MFQSSVLKIIQSINSYLSDYVLITLLISVGIFYSIKTKWVQVTFFKDGIKKIFGDFSINGKKNDKSLSSFQALATAIAAQVGTGNIVGASGAILTGGPGAIFWMWIIAFFGMATIYAEATLAVNTRKIDPKTKEIKGGSVYYIKTAFKGSFGKFLTSFFSIGIIIALGFFGVMVQSNSIASTFSNAFNIKTYFIGIALVILCGAIFFGGVKMLASVLEKIVPLMAFLFMFGSIIVLIMNFKKIPETFYLMFKYAFTPNAIIGGSIGYALKVAIGQGVKRGLFSNEAGMGSTPHAHAMARVNYPHEQGIVAMMGVFIDTFVVLTLNAIVIISTMYTEGGVLAHGYVGEALNTINKGNLAQTAFGTVMGANFGKVFVAFCLFFFAFSTIIGWSFFSKINMQYLFGENSVKIYYIIAIIFIFLGSITSNDLVWELQDMFDQLIVIPNVIALYALHKIVVKEVKDAKLRKIRKLK
ncbi:MAG: amino acid carrier protein [Lachnospiraceae bacterium]|nr:amino acid carrier protein [Lachnospiraceae bacterium]